MCKERTDFVRICPKLGCGREMFYKSNKALIEAMKTQTLCRRCAGLSKKKRTEFARKCSNPNCKNEIFYKTEGSLFNATKANSLCRNCCVVNKKRDLRN